jgi:hypothetical protein
VVKEYINYEEKIDGVVLRQMVKDAREKNIFDIVIMPKATIELEKINEA